MLNETPRAVRLGAMLYGLQGVFLAVEALWITVGPRWFESARFWATLHSRGAVIQIAAGSVVWLFVASSVARRQRWAWVFALASAGLETVGSIVALLLAPFFIPVTDLRRHIGSHPGVAIAWAVTFSCLAASVCLLAQKEARQSMR